MSIFTRCNALCNTALLTLLLLPALLHAEQEERWYQVEVIIFSQNNPGYHESELWPLDYTLPDLEKSRELIIPERVNTSRPTALLPQPFSLVSKESLQLGDTAQRIQRASDVELMLHLGWLQPGLSEEQAVAVHIYEGMLNKPDETTTTEVPETGTSLPKLDGSLRLILSRYLHLESDLIWREPLPPGTPGFAAELPVFSEAMGTDHVQPPVTPNGEEQTLTVNGQIIDAAQGGDTLIETVATIAKPGYRVFRLQQSRRMRSSEIHYLDHPLFGIIALVTPYDLAPPEPAAAVSP
jgi:hypothetical protein